MGSRADISELLSQCLWSEEGSYLGEVSKSAGFPCVVKVLRGQYQNVGQPSFSNPSLVSHLLLTSAGKQLSIAAQCVKFKNSRVVPFGPTLSIPNSFEGHFEILNEDGKSVPCIQNVSDLSRKFPDSCLVREPIKGYKPDTKSMTSGTSLNGGGVINNVDVFMGGGGGGGVIGVNNDSNNITNKNCNSSSNNDNNSNNYKVSDKTRIIQPGEILVLVGEVVVPSGKKVSRYLRCFDSKGQTIFLNSSQKGKFSPLAGENSIGGVHRTKNILNKRMPMMVRLVDGKPPAMSSSKSSSFKFVPELRLFSTIQEELIFAMPLSQSSKDSPVILPLPLSVPLKFQVCRNMGEVEGMKEFCRIFEKMKTLVDQSKSAIQIYDINLKKELRFDGRQWKAYTPPIFLSPSTPDMIISTPQDLPLTSVDSQNGNNYDVPDVQDYEDIDQIYDYVRGIKPGPPKILHGNKHYKETKLSRSITNLANISGTQPQAILISPTNNSSNNNNNNNNSSGGVGNVGKQRQLYPHQRHSITSPSDSHHPPPHNIISITQDHNNKSNNNHSDKPPDPPPIETIPTNKNKHILLGNSGSGSGGVSVSVGNVVKVAIQSDNKLADQKQEYSKNVKNSRSHHHQIYSNSNNNHNHNHSHQTSVNISSSPSPHTPILMMNANSKNSHSSSSHNNINNLISSGSHIVNISNSNNNNNIDSNNSTANSRDTPTNTSSGSSSEKKKVKHLYVKHNSGNSGSGSNNISNSINNMNGFLEPSTGISGSPTNRIIFRRSPIFDCRYKSMYKSMNDLNRSSLESGASAASSSQKMRYFQHNHHGMNVNNLLGSSSSHINNTSHGNLNLNVNLNVKASTRHKGIFRPKSLTNITLDDLLSPSTSPHHHHPSHNHHHHHHQHQLNSSHNNSSNNLNCTGSGGSKKKLDMIIPSHPPPPLIPRQSQRSRKSQPATLYL